jgi:hypothetical protein
MIAWLKAGSVIQCQKNQIMYIKQFNVTHMSPLCDMQVASEMILTGLYYKYIASVNPNAIVHSIIAGCQCEEIRSNISIQEGFRQVTGLDTDPCRRPLVIMKGFERRFDSAGGISVSRKHQWGQEQTNLV